MINQKFNKWTVIQDIGKDKWGLRYDLEAIFRDDLPEY